MSEERLNEIKDSIEFQLRVCEINNYETDMIIEEKELYNEVLSNKMLIQELRDTIDNQKEEIDRLNNIIDEIKKLCDENTNGIDDDGYDDAYYDRVYVREIEKIIEELKEKHD